MSRQLDVVHPQDTEHPHALLLAVARHVLAGLKEQALVVRHIPAYSANPDHFRMQMEVFDRMRATEREFWQR